MSKEHPVLAKAVDLLAKRNLLEKVFSKNIPGLF
jgi:hypothetical protein